MSTRPLSVEAALVAMLTSFEGPRALGRRRRFTDTTVPALFALALRPPPLDPSRSTAGDSSLVCVVMLGVFPGSPASPPQGGLCTHKASRRAKQRGQRPGGKLPAKDYVDVRELLGPKRGQGSEGTPRRYDEEIFPGGSPPQTPASLRSRGLDVPPLLRIRPFVLPLPPSAARLPLSWSPDGRARFAASRAVCKLYIRGTVEEKKLLDGPACQAPRFQTPIATGVERHWAFCCLGLSPPLDFSLNQRHRLKPEPQSAVWQPCETASGELLVQGRRGFPAGTAWPLAPDSCGPDGARPAAFHLICPASPVSFR